MPRKVDFEELLANNPHIDREQLEKSEELRRKLESMGVKGKTYELAPLYGGRRVPVSDDGGDDPPPLRSRKSRGRPSRSP